MREHHGDAPKAHHFACFNPVSYMLDLWLRSLVFDFRVLPSHWTLRQKHMTDAWTTNVKSVFHHLAHESLPGSADSAFTTALEIAQSSLTRHEHHVLSLDHQHPSAGSAHAAAVHSTRADAHAHLVRLVDKILDDVRHSQTDYAIHQIGSLLEQLAHIRDNNLSLEDDRYIARQLGRYRLISYTQVAGQDTGAHQRQLSSS